MSTLQPEERHQIILNYLKDIKKPTKVFQLRWHEPALLTEKVVTQTPTFWYRKHGWKREHVEEMFYKAEIEMPYELEKGLDAVFGGGYTAKRWKNTAIADDVDHIWDKLYKNKAISSKFEKHEYLKFDDFLKSLKCNNVHISDTLSRNIFTDIDIKQDNYITKIEMLQYLSKLDTIKLNDISDLINNPQMLNIAMTKHILECILSDEGLKFVENNFIIDLKAQYEFEDPECLIYLNKLMDRDIEWEERVFAMHQMNIGLVSGKWDKLLINNDQIRQLLFGFAAQLLDENINVQSKALEMVPNILDECFNKVVDINVVYAHLPEIIDNIFKVLDNPKCVISHQSAKYAIDELIDNIVNTQHPVATLQLAKIFSGQCKLENAIKAGTRSYGLTCLSKIMFGLDSPYLSFNIKEMKAPVLDETKLPPKGDPYREWFDQAISHQPGPSLKYLIRASRSNAIEIKKYRKGGENDLMFGYGRGSRDYIGDDDEKDGENRYRDRNESLVDKTANEIGAEFVDAVSNGLSAAMMDTNRENKINAFKTNHILNEMEPEFSEHLDKESKKRYDEWQFGGMKPYGKKEPKALPGMNKIDHKLVQVTTKTKSEIDEFHVSLPDLEINLHSL